MRLIDIDDISLRKTIACGGLSAKALWRRIQQQPTIDAESVVRCRECRHNPKHTNNYMYGKCPCCCEDDYYSRTPDDDFYCSYGERSGNE